MTYGATNLKDVVVRPCPANDLEQLDGQRFIQSCEVKITEHPDREAAKAYVAEVLAGNDLELEPVRLACDRALNAKKATARFYDLADNFALQQQIGRNAS